MSVEIARLAAWATRLFMRCGVPEALANGGADHLVLDAEARQVVDEVVLVRGGDAHLGDLRLLLQHRRAGALGMAGHKVWNMFAPDAKKAVQEAAGKYAAAEETLAKEAPKLPGVGGAAGGDVRTRRFPARCPAPFAR